MILNSAELWGAEDGRVGAKGAEAGRLASRLCRNPPGKFVKQNLTGSGGAEPANLPPSAARGSDWTRIFTIYWNQIQGRATSRKHPKEILCNVSEYSSVGWGSPGWGRQFCSLLFYASDLRIPLLSSFPQRPPFRPSSKLPDHFGRNVLLPSGESPHLNMSVERPTILGPPRITTGSRFGNQCL